MEPYQKIPGLWESYPETFITLESQKVGKIPCYYAFIMQKSSFSWCKYFIPSDIFPLTLSRRLSVMSFFLIISFILLPFVFFCTFYFFCFVFFVLLLTLFLFFPFLFSYNFKQTCNANFFASALGPSTRLDASNTLILIGRCLGSFRENFSVIAHFSTVSSHILYLLVFYW